ncbi:BZ3500_MvSof-1268-A1-R1_Chr3-2g06309 [Microbotryum saponariae]|uniref:BZ3500_MvSof-1268-A1-R1_Chr3-2g06309 protein n=1 Tax=Microbotryum saponariae TaxID=289078 RepID=A0A2X0LQ67_9BASI|nr:BZ3500_MvSof-1268-A1-R1_Chr3-2g06309 [Microbotryum saponariae]SDA04280.1 BZ3501_MvSof-1269-A2-R1_Chr3-2g06000 [Microbotryum saponariae]
MPLTSAADCVDPPLVDRTWTRVERLEPREHQVNDADDSDEWEQDEVTYLTLDFGAKLAVETLNQERGHIQLLGLESSTPYARVGPQFYQGQHETLIGDQVLLQHHPETETSPSHYAPLPSTSTSRIYFRPVSIRPKEDPVPVADPTTRTSPIPASLLTTGKLKFKSRVAPRAENAPPKVAKVKKKPGRPKGSKNKYKKGQWADEDDAEDANDGEGMLPALPTLEMEDPEELEGRSSLQGRRSPTPPPPPPPPPPPKRRGRPPKPKDPNAPPTVAKKAKAPAKRRVKRVESDASLDSSDFWEGGRMDVDEASEEEYVRSNVDTSSNAAAGESTRRVPRRSAATAAAAAVAGGEKLVISDDDEDEA